MWYPIPNEPLPKKILETIRVATPYFNASVLRAQDRHSDVSGRDRLHFCGSAWANGIHEGGLRSALAVAAKFGKGIADIRL